MKHGFRCAAVTAALCVLSILLLSGCSSFSSGDYVQSNLDLIYLDQYTDESLQQVNLSEDEAHQKHEDKITAEAQTFASYFAIELDSCDSSVQERIHTLYQQIYPNSKYVIGSPATSDGVYLVPVTIYPIDIIDKAMENSAAFSESWQARIDAGEFTALSETEYETAWANAILDLVSENQDTIGYLEPQTISVQVTKDDDGAYHMDESEFQRINSLIIDYAAD